MRLRVPLLLSIIAFFVFCQNALGQKEYAFPASRYNTPENPLYWKNNPPYAGYWQQDVHYRIQAELIDTANEIRGQENLTYWNNSPDTLRVLYFHLYQNAFTPGSYMADQHKANNYPLRFGRHEAKGEGTQVESILWNGKPLATRLDNTILEVKLPAPLLPGGNLKLDIRFRTWFDAGGSMRRRMKTFTHGRSTHFDGVHWYPRISVYDAKFGWDVNQHLGREFYGDYGTFDVSLTLPSHYVMDATGVLLNEKEVLPDELRRRLDIANFKDRKPGDKITQPIPKDGTTKTWHFHAENVHDFAWTADPSYRISEANWNGIRCIALAQEDNAQRWQTASAFTARVIETFSRDFGMYAWPKIIVADAADGMEYPMLTLCGGGEPDFHNVITHEVGHEWFFGMLGSNETYRAFLDEGFTQFLTAWGLERLDGPNEVTTPPHSKYQQRFMGPRPVRELRLIQPYIRLAQTDEPPTINTHSDHFNGALGHGGGYGAVYYKGGTMLYNLRYILGDSLFQAAMRHYVSHWKIRHPYPEDFRNSIIRFTHVDLNWFFDQWLETTKTIDYKIAKVRPGDKAGEYRITFKRLGMQMPVDFVVTTTDGKQYGYTIPNTYFAKNAGMQVLPPWIGWDNVRPTYEAVVQIEGKLKNVVIDTSLQMSDISLLNNSTRKKRLFYFDSQVWRAADRRYYEHMWRPDLWYNAEDGIKAGLHLEGSYMGMRRVYSLTAWYNTRLLADGRDPDVNLTDRLNANFTYASPLKWLDRGLTGRMNLRLLDGLALGQIGIKKELQHNNQFSLDYKAYRRVEPNDTAYLLYPGQWGGTLWNTTLNGEFRHGYNALKSNGWWALRLRTSAPGSDYNFRSLAYEWQHNTGWRKFQLRLRGYAQYIDGASIAPESRLFLAGANPEEMQENKYYRSRGFFPAGWQGYGNTYNHLHAGGGGLNLRGYSGYLAPEGIVDQQYVYAGTAGAALNGELDFSRYLGLNTGGGISRILPRSLRTFSAKVRQTLQWNTYLFADAGVINKVDRERSLALAAPRMDAGLGVALTIKKWGPLQKTAPLTLRFDMPLYLSKAPFTDSGQNFKFRWVAGIGRAF